VSEQSIYVQQPLGPDLRGKVLVLALLSLFFQTQGQSPDLKYQGQDLYEVSSRPRPGLEDNKTAHKPPKGGLKNAK